nr:energy-coupling factor transporter ATPase [uncultured Sellimonas sp.]
MSMVKTEKLVFEYEKRDEDGNVIGKQRAIDDVSLEIEEGQFVAVLGHNGSGKSTFAKHINAILVPEGGTVWVGGKDTRDDDELWNIRQSAGMVFQNPDNQIIATVVEEDVGFGPENLGVPTQEIWEQVEDSLRKVGMLEYRHSSPNKLSGGQKQRVAIAGVVAMKPKCIVLDEPTAMLDPNGRKEVIQTVKELQKQEKVTVILITHYMEEVIEADYVYVMDKGKVVMKGKPNEIFSQVDMLKHYRLDVPQVTAVADALIKRGIPMPADILTREEFEKEIHRLAVQNGMKPVHGQMQETSLPAYTPKSSELVLSLKGVNYVYNPGTAYEKAAMKDVNLDIYQGEFIGIIGHTGSGKSTLIQHLNGLLKATGGEILFHGQNIYDQGYSMKELRQQVGLVFQYPEHQLFEVDVISDVCFGPKNQGLSQEECEKRAKEALEMVGFPESAYKASPFDLSGGQKRRVAIAGVLAMRPKILVLDEPTAGLDPKGRDDILDQIAHLQKTTGITVILVSHSMEDVAKYVDRIIVMNKGEKIFDDTPKRVFRHYKRLEEVGLAAPEVTYLMHELREEGLPVSVDVTLVEEAAEEIERVLKR